MSQVQMDRSDPSCVSMKSDWSMDPPPNLLKHNKHHFGRVQMDRSDPSCVSMKSDWSMDPPPNLLKHNKRRFGQVQMDRSDPSCVSMKSDWSMDPPPNLQKHNKHRFGQVQMDRSDPSCVSMKSDWSMDPPPNLQKHNKRRFGQVQMDRSDPSCVSMKSDWSMDPPPNLQKHNKRRFGPDPKSPEVLKTFRSNLQKKFECLYEGTSMQGNPTLLNEIYTELYITESESGEISNEHEVRQIETQSRRTTTEETPIKCNDIFKPLPEQYKHIRSVLTKGVAGIGKTVSVQKFILDWAEEKKNQDIHLIFPLPFREINLMKDKTLSLLDLLHLFFPQTKEMEIFSDEYKVLFIFDGLDECRLSLDFHSSVRLCDVSESTSVDVMLTNLIKGNLCPSALIWITSRPAAADLIPSECVDRVTEVRGFSDPQKEEYFRKRISDESLSDQIISHLKSSRSLYIMCHIPVFCWISVTVLERMMSEAESQEIPKTLTEMYTHFLIIQTNIKHQKDYEKKVKKDEGMIFKLGKLAFEQLMKGNLIFYDEDLRDCGIDVSEASVYSGLCTQIFREEFGLLQGKVYCFIHLSIQEHLAALYVLYSFLYKRDLLNEYLPSEYANEFIYGTISDLHQRAVDKSLQSKNGHLDLFLRFLLGLSLESNQKLLQDLLKHKEKISWSKEKTVDYIKTRIKLNPDKSINLFHSLNELGDQSLVNEVQVYVQSGNLSNKKITSSQWSAVVFILLTSEQLNVFKLSKYINRDINKDHMTSDEVLQKLLPVVEASRSAELTDCELSEKSCSGLTSVLTSKSSCLRDLNLSKNKQISDSGVKLICDGLKNPNCKLEKLKLRSCHVTDEGCAALTSALISNSHLRDLDLFDNKQIRDSGVKLICDGLKNPNCKLEKLTLYGCDVTDEGCAALASALISNTHLRDLDLSNNKLRDSGVKLICDGLKNPNCKLEKLKLYGCDVTDEGCAALASALRSNTHLRDLNLSNNNLRDSGVKLLSDVLKNPNCKLEKLRLYGCDVTDEGCAALASALISNTHLRDLDLSNNKLRDSGVKLICDGLKNPNCKLEKLKLYGCDVTDEGCAALASALRSNTHLRDLNLSNNNLRDSGVKLLSDVLKNPNCKLEKLRLSYCYVTDEGCAALTSALISNSHLRDLDLFDNKQIRDSGVKLICDGLKNPNCKLEKLTLSYCGVTDEGCAALASALKSNSHLRDLNLTENNLSDSGVKLLSDVLKNPNCKLEKLGFKDCDVTDEGCAALASALRSNPHLRDLDLYYNKLRDSAVKRLCDGLKNPNCKLEKLKFKDCDVTDEGCAALASALRSNSHLRDLNLPHNKLRDSGVKRLSDGLKNPNCKLETLRLKDCDVKDEGCAALASVLRSNPSHLRDLDLSQNKQSDPGKKLLSDLKEGSHYKLETLSQVQTDRSDPSCVSMKSDWSMDNPPELKEHNKLDFGRVQMDRSDPSCVSMKSDWSMDPPPRLQEHNKRGFGSLDKLQILESPEPICVSMNSDQSLNLPPILEKGSDFSPNPKCAEVLNTFRSNLQKKFQCLCEGTSSERNPTLLNEIYTELNITESESGEISNEHEVRQIETQSRRTTTEETPIKCNDIFKPLPEQDKPIRSVLTKGVAGIGKTVSVQKFILDWAEEKENQDVHLIFPLPFREINLMKNRSLSLLDLLHLFFPQTKEMEIFSDEYKVLFIFDGLDECRLSLDFHSSVWLCDVSESTSVDLMLTNLIKGNLFPSSLIWITSRPAAADLIPSECVDRVTEIRGFSDPQKEEYFRKRISDESLSDQIISHLKSSRSLYIMCHIPVFCWISVTVLERMMREAEGQEIPKTLTEMYTHFLIIQTNIKHQKDYEKKDDDMIFKLGKLAFEQLMKGNLIFYDEDLRDCGIDVSEASVYSGLCTQIFREEFGFYQGKVYSFVHLSIQEHLAALYVLYSFLLYKRDLLNEYLPSKYPKEFTCDTILDLHQRAVDKSLKSENGHLDLFLRFLLGLSLESNQKLLQDLLKHKEKISWSKEKTVEYIKTRIKINPKPDKSINLFHSLNELGDQSLVNEVQEYIKSKTFLNLKLSSSQWSAVVFILLTSEQLDVFDLSKYINRDLKRNMTQDEVLQKLRHVVQGSRSAELCHCELSEKCCDCLTSVISSKSSCLRKMNLSENNLRDSGVKQLSVGLKNPNCKLETLRLCDCDITDDGCAALASALRSTPSYLKELDLSDNNLRDSGVKLLSEGLKNPNCKLEKLELRCCGVTDEGCAALASALISNPSHLKELNLSGNKQIRDSGVKLLSDGLKNINCELEKLRLSYCGVTDEGCAALASALKSNPSHLRDLYLSDNNLRDSGVKLLFDGLKNPNCKLEKLVLWDCGVTDEGCAVLASALRSNPSHMRELDLSENNLKDSGVKLLCEVLKNPNCKLEKLWLNYCGVTDEGCTALASALRSNPSHLRELNLFKNKLGDSGRKMLSDLKEDPHYKLETLNMVLEYGYEDLFVIK
ncbi:uncharacterized protein [Paramisgurnus dabryanus]|uniref:uncharacterized protein isoform X3 n=1 Tax=Paramisgurnus dabryanus TaxID=90735 RepID=UPI003CCFD97B